MKTAFITGITGQDGYYLCKHLLENDYQIHGTIRRSSSINTSRIDGLISQYTPDNQLILHYSDLLDSASMSTLINKIQPDEVYNLAAQSHVAVSFKTPVFSSQTSTLGPLSLLEPLRKLDKKVKFYQASSSEMYGGATEDKLDEKSEFDPKSHYAAAKVFAHNLSKIYRESYDMFCVNGILFNHESPHRGETFVTRKITRAVGRIKLGLQSKLTLGNLDAKRDWGFAGDYVVGMWKMMQHETPEDWVLATGVAYSVEDFVNVAFNYADIDPEEYISTSEKYMRPNEVHHLLGDSSKAQNQLGWKPETKFEDLVKMMVDHDLNLAKQEKTLIDNNLIKPTWESPVV